MKFFVEKNQFSYELRLFQGIFEKKSLMDILQNIKFSLTDDGVLSMMATDLEIGLKSEINVDIVEKGSFTLNGKDIYDLISKMPEGIIEVSENNDMQVRISNQDKTCQYVLLGLQASDYPDMPKSDFVRSISIPLDVLNSFIYKNYYIISPEIKFNLGGALFKISENLLEMVSTDGHRLAYSYYSPKVSFPNDFDFIISRKTLLEINKLGDKGDLILDFDSNNLFFKHNNHELSSRIIDQKFPNYKTVIPTESKYSIQINKENLQSSLKRSLIFKTRNNGIFFKFNNMNLILERVTPEKGESRDEIPIDYTGPNVEVAFNGMYIIDFLNHCDVDEILIEMNDAESSFIFRPKIQADVGYTYVVMPLHI
jgi:DNA polymerase-3 subunit beta